MYTLYYAGCCCDVKLINYFIVPLIYKKKYKEIFYTKYTLNSTRQSFLSVFFLHLFLQYYKQQIAKFFMHFLHLFGNN